MPDLALSAALRPCDALASRNDLEGSYDRRFHELWTAEEEGGAAYGHLSDEISRERHGDSVRYLSPAPLTTPATSNLDRLARLGVLRDAVGIDHEARRRRDYRFGLFAELVARETGDRFEVVAPADLPLHVLRVWEVEQGTVGEIDATIDYYEMMVAAAGDEAEAEKLRDEVRGLRAARDRHWKATAEWLRSTAPFDFSVSCGPLDPDVLAGFADNERLTRSLVRLNGGNDWAYLTRSTLRRLLVVDREIFESGTDYIANFKGNNKYSTSFYWHEGREGAYLGEELVAARELARRDPTFWPTLRKIGPTPAMVKRAHYILREEPEYVADLLRNTGRYNDIVLRPTMGSRSRCSQGRPAHLSARRRRPSRSPGGGDDDGGGGGSGGSDPPAGPRPAPSRRRWPSPLAQLEQLQVAAQRGAR